MNLLGVFERMPAGHITTMAGVPHRDGIAVTPDGVLYFCDSKNKRVRRVASHSRPWPEATSKAMEKMVNP